jgi:hypothetical protein
MASVYTKYCLFMCILILVSQQSCTNHKETYASDCDHDIAFKRVNYTNLMDSLKFYDKKYIEISGRYATGKEQSALFSDSLFMIQPAKAFWINFSTDCPLYLSGTHIGFFDYDKGGFAGINNKKIRVRGKLDLHNHGYQKQYRGCIDHVSFIEL